MPQRPQGLVEVDATSTELICKFPPNMRLHSAKHGIFKLKIQGCRLITINSGCSVLRDIVEGLQQEVDDLVDVSGNYWQLKIQVVCEDAIDNVLKHLAIACAKNGFRLKVKARQTCTAVPRYAV